MLNRTIGGKKKKTKWMVKIINGKPIIKNWDDLGVSLFLETPKKNMVVLDLGYTPPQRLPTIFHVECISSEKKSYQMDPSNSYSSYV